MTIIRLNPTFERMRMSESSVDLSLCRECWVPFDAEEHEPKLLKCPSHPLATVCLQCLKTGKACKNDECKTCRDACASWAIDELPLNTYALQLAQWKKMNVAPPTEAEAPIEEPPNNNQNVTFDYHRCPFVFSFKIGENDLGEVHVMSTPFVIQHKFVQALGEYCFRMPREFQIFGEPEFKPESFCVLECHHSDFQPFESEVMIYADPLKLELIGEEQLAKLDAAMEPTFDEDGRLSKVKCIFFVKDNSGVVEGGKVIKKSSETIWGTITRGHSLLDWMIANIPERGHHRTGLKPTISFTLETRNPVDL